MKNSIKKNIYKWHRALGLLTIIPVLFWCLSGLMHPFLSHWFKPQIAHEWIPAKPLKPSDFQYSIPQVLRKNGMEQLKKYRAVQFDGQTYYQIKNLDDRWRYFNTRTGEELKDGDRLYAVFLARYFLQDSLSPVKSISLQTEFSQQYKYINRLLPVWKVSFDRADEMDIYVETPYSRLGTFNPSSRKWFLWVFDNFHNWSFLSDITNNTIRILIMILFLTIIGLSAFSGILIYGFMWRWFKKPDPGDKKGILRRYHRQIGISVALVTLTFAFSGGYHATQKLEPNYLPRMSYEPVIDQSEFPDSIALSAINWDKLTNMSMIKKDTMLFHQFFYKSEKGAPPEIVYVNMHDGSIWQNGNMEYAIWLSQFFRDFFELKQLSGGAQKASNGVASGSQTVPVLKTEWVPAFEKREYGFAFKRLPVIRISYDTPEKTNDYIEPNTCRLAASIDESDRYEGYSFAVFHKFLFLEWAGKDVRDMAMVLSVFGIFTISLMGLVLYLKK
jgi:hypothetical protein